MMVFATTMFIDVRTLSGHMSRPSTGSKPPDDRLRKSVLICPECAPTSAPDGDWRLDRRFSATVYECPQCATAITRRPPRRRWGQYVGAIAALPALALTMWTDSLRELNRLLQS